LIKLFWAENIEQLFSFSLRMVPTRYKGLLPEIELWKIKKTEQVELVEIEDSNKGYKPMGIPEEKWKKTKVGNKNADINIVSKKKNKKFSSQISLEFAFTYTKAIMFMKIFKMYSKWWHKTTFPMQLLITKNNHNNSNINLSLFSKKYSLQSSCTQQVNHMFNRLKSWTSWFHLFEIVFIVCYIFPVTYPINQRLASRNNCAIIVYKRMHHAIFM